MDLAAFRRALGREHHPWPKPSTGQPYAAVAAILRAADDGLEVLLIRRAQRSSDPWSGQMAFPGGRAEQSDRDLVATAQRETLEEVGLDLRHQAELLGWLDPLEAMARGRPTGMKIVPVVFGLQQTSAHVEVRPSDAEVEAVVWAPIAPMLSGQADASKPYRWQGRELELPAFAVGGDLVWGLTHRMLSQLFAALQASGTV